MRLLGEERSTSSSSGNPRSPSPPVRRSISTDRGALLRSKVKTETNENQPIAKPSSFLDIQKTAMGSTKKKQLVCQEKNEQDSRKSDFSEMENEQFLWGMPLGGALKVKKACHNFPRNSQNLEPPR